MALKVTRFEINVIWKPDTKDFAFPFLYPLQSYAQNPVKTTVKCLKRFNYNLNSF